MSDRKRNSHPSKIGVFTYTHLPYVRQILDQDSLTTEQKPFTNVQILAKRESCVISMCFSVVSDDVASCDDDFKISFVIFNGLSLRFSTLNCSSSSF